MPKVRKPEGWDDQKPGQKLLRITDKAKEVITPIKANIVKTPHIGVLRLDYHYPAAKLSGDVVSRLSFDYGLVPKSVKGLTFAMIQEGFDSFKNDATTMSYLNQAIVELDNHEHVVGITGSCGFMLAIQQYCKNLARKTPVFLSSLMLAPLIERTLTQTDYVMVLTANSDSLTSEILSRLLIDVAKMPSDRTHKFFPVGCQNVKGFGLEVEKGMQVDFEEAELPLLEMVDSEIRKKQAENINVAALLLECTELPQFSNSLRLRFNLPVFDVINLVDMFHSSTSMSTRFGIQPSSKL